MNTINTAAREYATRPPDERFASLTALVEAAQYDKDHSVERTYNLKDLRVVPVTDRQGMGQTLALESPKGQADFTHYSFGQLCRTVGAPAGYLRELPPTLAADCLNDGLATSPVGTSANLLVRANGGQPVVRAATSDTYGRAWDAGLYGEIQRYFGDGATSAGGQWQSPPTWSGEPAGQYRGDRDSFVIRVDGGSIVSDPSARGEGGQLYRGLMVRNSEVGHCAISLECVLYRFVCGNHMLWGAVMDRQFRRRHVGTHVTRDTVREILTVARRFNTRSASEDERIIRGLIDHAIAATKEAVIDELRKMGASKADAATAYERCEVTEGVSPRSFWGIAQGLTRASQESGYQDERLQLDQLAGLVLKRGAQLVTV